MNDESKALNMAVLTIAFVSVVKLMDNNSKTDWGRIAVGGCIYLLALSLINGYDSTLTYRFSLLVLTATALSQTPAVYTKISKAMS